MGDALPVELEQRSPETAGGPAALRTAPTQLEREAERIAHALHDEAGQFLTAAHIVLADVARDLPPVAQARLQEVRRHLNQVEEQLRTLSRELRPRILEDLGLRAALAFLAEGVAKRTGAVVTMQVVLDARLPPLIETTLYRLVQEALTNASRHAKATHVTVTVARDGLAVQCTIHDDGVGFAVPRSSGARAPIPGGSSGSGTVWRPWAGHCRSIRYPPPGPP